MSGAGRRNISGSCTRNMTCFPHRSVLDNLTDSIGLEFPKELALRKAVVTLRMAGFSEEKSLQILNRFPSRTVGRGTAPGRACSRCSSGSLVLLFSMSRPATMDPITKQDVKHSILHARDEMDETFIVVSHDMDFVRDICDRLALMRGGKIIQIGSTSEILSLVTEEEKND